jgi:arylsulfatase A-like enzyme
VDAFDKSSTIATWLQDQGYDTAMIGKYFNNYVDQRLGRGWDRSVVKINYPRKIAAEMADDGCAYHMNVDGSDRCIADKERNYYTYRLERYANKFILGAENPFFLYWTPAAPHKPATPAPEDVGLYDGIAPYRPASHNEVDVTDKPVWLQLHEPLSGRQVRENDLFRQHQLESLQAVDRAVDNFVTLLTDQGEMQNTLFIFSSDNGMMWGEHRLEGKQMPYEESITVPLVIRADWLISNPGAVEDRVVANIDIAPTIAQLTGATPTLDIEGESIVPLLDGTAGSWREGVGLEHLTHKDVVSFCGYRSQDYSFLNYADGVQELYDLNADPLQLTNLAANPTYDSVRDDLRTKALDICDPPPPGRWNP